MTFMELPAKFYRTRPIVAREKGVPIYFKAAILRETARAVYLYGYGEIDPEVRCSKCGRALTHPGSKLIGIGPECLKDWGLRDLVLESLSPEQIEMAKGVTRSKVIDSWFPKSVLIAYEDAGTVQVPSTHKSYDGAREPQKSIATLIKENTMKLTFEPTGDLLGKVKSLPNRSFISKETEKYWIASASPTSIKQVKEWGFSIDEGLSNIMSRIEKSVHDMKEANIEGLKKTLRPFQAQGVAFLEHRNGKAIIGDDMGLGKTIQALAYLHAHPELKPAIVLSPAVVKYHWLNEVKGCLSDDRKAVVLEGKKAYQLDNPDIIILNYDIVAGWQEYLASLSPKVLVLDECQAIMNNTTLRTKAVKALAKRIPHIIPMSGTPVINRPKEIYNAIRMVEPNLFPNFMHFANRYCGAKHNGFGWDYNGASNLEELYEKLQGVMIRRRKEEVLTELPPKQRAVIPVALSNEREYRRVEKDFIGWVTEKKGKLAAVKASNAEALSQISALRFMAAKGALKGAIEWIKDFLNDTIHKLVVFAVHKEIISALMDEFGTDIAVKIDGSVSAQKRSEIVDRFQNDPSVRLFVGNIKAAGVGITLTASHNVAFLELPWTPGLLDQAEDRCNRIGQKNAVNIWYLLPRDTIEERLAEMIDDKRKVITAILDGEDVPDSSMLTAMLNSYAE
jgi:SWI/SNF-related matrix-associated actin-dependent regulator 1 of chromatin subfamily A